VVCVVSAILGIGLSWWLGGLLGLVGAVAGYAMVDLLRAAYALPMAFKFLGQSARTILPDTWHDLVALLRHSNAD